MPWTPEHRSLSFDHRDACLMLGALRDSLAKEHGTLAMLLLTRERDLERFERFMLPHNLRQLSREDLQEQIDAWISLCDQIKWLIKEFEKVERETSPPSIQKRRAAGEIL